jgi:hypothetical protein
MIRPDNDRTYRGMVSGSLLNMRIQDKRRTGEEMGLDNLGSPLDDV